MKIKNFAKNGQLFAIIPFFSSENIHDNVIVDKYDPVEQSSDLTGSQRLRNLFKRQLECPVDPRIIDLSRLSLTSFIIGAIYGGVTKSRETFINFIEKNEATQFRSHLDAKRKLSDKMFLSFIQGSVKWGSRVGFFCTTFMVTYTVLSVYQNNDSLFYYTLSGLTAGSLYKVPLGPKGMISGGFFGAAFGSLFAGLKFIQLLLINKTEEELRNYRISKRVEELKEASSPKYNLAYQDSKKELEELLRNH